MLSIDCPHCGQRDETEFVCGGEAPTGRPPPDASDDIWTDYLFGNANPRGPVHERWLHAFGCRRWLAVERDTVTHRILSVRDFADAIGHRP
ncbi:sarcosine oxidase subunit delta [Sphingosinicella terrae]|uniref:sarcosine oxidase subunit delta n=1 Tax=Sphingosinicella terrae TaxID=2172047 RepID=UPI000E0DE0C8|nr:sarcosine oxidase subunit delta [Sphingosinicella terrae]